MFSTIPMDMRLIRPVGVWCLDKDDKVISIMAERVMVRAMCGE